MTSKSEEEFMEVFSKITGAKFVDVTPKNNVVTDESKKNE